MTDHNELKPRVSKRRRHEPREEDVSLFDRLAAALLLPFFFNLSMLIVAACLGRYGLYGLMHVYAASGLGALLFVVLPAIVGLVGGTSGAMALLGHAFLMHPAVEQNIVITAAIWGFVAGSILVVALI